MPIYAYKCESCGFSKDVLQKMSDAQLTDCPQCAAATFRKQVTAAGFQLKGSGWYVTDFRNGGGAAAPAAAGDAGQAAPATADGSAAKPAEAAAKTESAAPAAAAPAPSTPAAGSTPSTGST